MLPPLFNRIAKLVQRRPSVERRGAKRLTPGGLTPCLIHCAGADEPITAWLHNLSRTGVGIFAVDDIPKGTMIRIARINAPHTYALSGEVRVVRSIRLLSGDFLLGCEFTDELQHDEMVPFIL